MALAWASCSRVTLTDSTSCEKWQTFPVDSFANADWAQLAWGFVDGGHDTITTKTRMVFVDLDDTSTREEHLATGKIIICSFSAGSVETWREDVQANATAWANAVVGDLEYWDESWLDIGKLEELQNLMLPRLQKAALAGCHAIEPDNLDCFGNSDCWSACTGINNANEAYKRQLEYNQWLVSAAHSVGVGIGLKNALTMIDDVAADFDFAINEQCHEYDECDKVEPFLNLGKIVFNVEYINDLTICEVQTKGLLSKYCEGSADYDGLCGTDWTSCETLTTLEKVAEPTVCGSSIEEIVTTTALPTSKPTLAPTRTPTVRPSTYIQPTQKPSLSPTPEPSKRPTKMPTAYPTLRPTKFPTAQPTLRPTKSPTTEPTLRPSKAPTAEPSPRPSKVPTNLPTILFTISPSAAEATPSPTTKIGSSTETPTRAPTPEPTTKYPTPRPTQGPTPTPTTRPTKLKTSRPTKSPTGRPTKIPTPYPTAVQSPTTFPTLNPSITSTSYPTKSPSLNPTPYPTPFPTTKLPTPRPSKAPTIKPTPRPTSAPTVRPTKSPTIVTTTSPTATETLRPTKAPTTAVVTEQITQSPTRKPTKSPSRTPVPTSAPTSNNASTDRDLNRIETVLVSSESLSAFTWLAIAGARMFR